MRLTKIHVNNYRILRSLELDLEPNLSLVIGKNNCGKTSLLSILNKFIGGSNSPNSFSYDDFNVEFKERLFNTIDNDGADWNAISTKGIELYLFIKYDENDNISRLKPLFFDLDPDNNTVVLKFEYIIENDKLMSLVKAFNEYYSRFKDNPDYKKPDCFNNFIKTRHRKYFQIIRKAVRFDPVSDSIVAEDYKIFDSSSSFDVSKIISFRYISARRNTENKDNDGTLSSLSERYYEKTKPNEDTPVIQNFEDTLVKTDTSLSEIYQELFSNVIEKVKKFGGIKENETIVKIISTLNQRQLLKGNATVIYEANTHQLPESYNGLGYLNLISMIIEIETLLSDFRHDKDTTSSPANINLLLIEEPEAHTHPQMQYVFIKNIKNLLTTGSSGADDKKSINLQTIISTHSPHIVAESDFDDIKYFQRINSTSVLSKNLKDLEIAYKDEKDPNSNHFKFLKQYLTLNYAEIFFADKAILYEGETERILLPPIMKKIDEEKPDENESPLLSQNISLIESGAYSQIFDKFLSFIGVKTLIITDIDSGELIKKPDKNGIVKEVAETSPVDKGNVTTNGALKHYYKIPLEQYSGTSQLSFFTERKISDKILEVQDGYWHLTPTGSLMVIYQISEDNYYPRSFEDAFLKVNRGFVIANKDSFASLKNKDYFEELSDDGEYKYDEYHLAIKCIKSKASFSLDVLLNSIEEGSNPYSNWKIPLYIEEGLLWLRKDSATK